MGPVSQVVSDEALPLPLDEWLNVIVATAKGWYGASHDAKAVPWEDLPMARRTYHFERAEAALKASGLITKLNHSQNNLDHCQQLFDAVVKLKDQEIAKLQNALQKVGCDVSR